LKLKYEASAVNLVMAAPRGASAEVQVLQDGKPLTRSQATKDIHFRNSGGTSESCVVVDSARMYALVDNHEFGEHELETGLRSGDRGLRFYFYGMRGSGRQCVACHQ